MSSPEGAPTDEGEGHEARWRALTVSCLGVFLLVMTLSALNVALPDIAASFDAEIEDLQWIVDAYAVTFAGLLLAGGAIGDRIGRRRALMIGFGVFAGANLLAAAAPSAAALIAMRALAGIGAAIMMPATLATVSEVFNSRDRGRAIAIWSSVAAGGGAFGPGLGGWLLSLQGWEAVFLANGALALVGLAGAVAWVPTLAGQRRGRFDGLGAALSVAAVASLVYLVIEGPAHPSHPATLFAAVASVVLVAAFVAREKRAPNPLLPLRLFDDRERVAGAGTLVLAALGFNGIFFVGALLLQIGWEESALVAGLLLMPVGVIEIIVANNAVHLKERFGAESTIATGLAVMAAGYVAMGFTPAGNRWWFIGAGLLAGAGNGLTIPLSIDRIMGDVEPAFAGVAASVNDMSIEFGASMGIGLLGALQRVWFERALPAGSEMTIAQITAAADRAAFRDASRAAFVFAAAIAVVAIPVATATRRAGSRFRPAAASRR